MHCSPHKVMFESLLQFWILCTNVCWVFAAIEATHGHYPSTHCIIDDALFISSDKVFYHGGVPEESNKCEVTKLIWPIRYQSNFETLKNETACSATFRIGFTYTIYYYYGGSNYYHMTYDMLIPLYKHIYYEQKLPDDKSVIFMPVVETRRLQPLDWETPGFKDVSKYWVEMSKFISGNSTFKPLDENFLTSYKTVCFDKIVFGAGSVDFSDSTLIQSYIHHVKKNLGITEVDDTVPRLALVSRKRKRVILNEQEVVDSLQNIISTDLIEFSGMSFSQQVALMQKYTIFAALNGAGLMNALYLPKNAVTIQMVPYKSGLNYKQYSILLKSRGPYLEWHNKFENMTVEFPGDKYNNKPNTVVHIDDFKKVVREAIELYNAAKRTKTEL